MKSLSRVGITVLASIPVASIAFGDTYHLVNEWSDSANPNGVWSYNEGTNPLPHVSAWQSGLGGWSSPQPGWADSENGNDRIPFWFKSNGSETFDHDWLEGDVVVHSTDGSSGVGNGLATLSFTVPFGGVAEIIGTVWQGRDIGRSNDWLLYHNDHLLTQGSLFTGDAFSRASPMDFASGTNGLSAIQDIDVVAGDQLKLVIAKTSDAGDFVGVNMRVRVVPEPATLVLVGVGAVLALRRRR